MIHRLPQLGIGDVRGVPSLYSKVYVLRGVLLPHRRSERGLFKKRMRLVRREVLSLARKESIYDKTRRERVYVGLNSHTPFLRGEVLYGVRYTNPMYLSLLHWRGSLEKNTLNFKV
ncbi:MAG: hypothetical protein QW186_07785 [Candidatus Bathyarchaeia archaeon]